MSASKEFNDKAIVLHQTLLAGSLTAFAQIAELLQPRILRGLSRKFSNVADEHLIQTAVNDALLYYLNSPNKFDANRGSLINFVWQRANSNLLNLLKENAKQNKFVELDEVQTVCSNEANQNETIEQFLIDDEQDDLFYKRLAVLLPDPVDRTILELMMNGERETVLFAAVLGISDKSPEEQGDCVKKHKDSDKEIYSKTSGRNHKMNGFNSETMLLNLAMELENDSTFMAHVLARYCQIEGLDKDALAVELGIPLFLFARLALCKRPDADSPNFINEISEIADYVPMDELRLVQIIREVDSLTVLGNVTNKHETEESTLSTPFSAGILAAARDRSEDENADETTKDEDEP